MQRKLPMKASHAVAVVVFVLAWNVAHSTYAQQGEGDKSAIHDVYITSDLSGQAEGGYVYVPRTLNDLLMQHGAALEGRSIKSIVFLFNICLLLSSLSSLSFSPLSITG